LTRGIPSNFERLSVAQVRPEHYKISTRCDTSTKFDQESSVSSKPLWIVGTSKKRDDSHRMPNQRGGSALRLREELIMHKSISAKDDYAT
jgi:hypothetical protein